MHYWLFKSEPSVFSWDDLLEKGSTSWDGVRNYQAANNMKAMTKGDLGFFYHSNEGLEIVGTVKLIRESYPDHTDPSKRFVMVDIKPLRTLASPVTLKAIKSNPKLKLMQIVTHSRLSVSKVSPEEWQEILNMSNA